MPKPLPGIPERFRDSRVDLEREVEREEDAATVKAFHSGGGSKFGVTIGSGAIVAIVTAVLTWFASHHGESPVDCASKGDLNAIDKHVSELSESVKDLATTLNRNADVAHNETQGIAVELHSYVNSHAK